MAGIGAGKGSGGRKLGAKNLAGKTCKENILAVFNRLDGTAGMAEWAMENKTEFYKIYAKLLPVEVDVSDSTLRVTITHFHQSEPKLIEYEPAQIQG